MNRVILSVLSQKNNLKTSDVEVLSQICQSRPLQNGWKSQKFAIFPLEINFYLSNPPFNKISLSIPQQYRCKMDILASKQGKQFFKLQQINQENDDFDDFAQGGIVSKFFKDTHFLNYLRFRFYSPQLKKGFKNICKQVAIRAIEVSHIIYFNTKYLCSLRKRLQLNPVIFRILELLQYKIMMIQKEKPNRQRTLIKQRYIKRMKEIEDLKYKNKLDPIHPEKQLVSKLSIQFEQLLSEPILQDQQLDFSNPIQLKTTIKKLQKQLAQFYVDRLNNLQPNVTDYFRRYWNIQIRDIYLRLLSSPDQDDKTKALVEFWSEIKSVQSIPVNIEEATLMFLNYYLEFIQISNIKIGAIKILCIFVKMENIGFKLYHIYSRILFNLINLLVLDPKDEMYKLTYKAVFILYKKVSNSMFLKEFLNRQTHSRDMMKLIKLQILQKIVLNDQSLQVSNSEKELITQFLLQILLIKQLTIQQKNKAYNVIAYLAGYFGKQGVMGDFQKLNSMLLMNMEKVVDKKLSQLKNTKGIQNSRLEGQFRQMCDYCGQQSQQFKDENIYDIHCFKECKMLTSCEHCSSIVQIPELFKHYLQECSLKNKFKNCDNCNDVILIAKEDEHRKKCLKNFVTKCPLCETKLESKLKIKEHILKDGCPNNLRDNKKQQIKLRGQVFFLRT